MRLLKPCTWIRSVLGALGIVLVVAGSVGEVDAQSIDFFRPVTIGNNIPGTAIAAVGAYAQYNATPIAMTSGNYTILQTDANGNLLINCSTGCSGGGGGGGNVTIVGPLDGSGNVKVNVAAGSVSATVAFPYGETTDGQTATTASTLGMAAFNGSTIDRVRTTGGTAHGILAATPCDPTTANQCAAVTSSNALKVDGSAVTQPVSGTLTATQGTAANLLTQVSQPTAASLNATVVQSTGSNLHVDVDSAPTLTVSGSVTQLLPYSSGATQTATANSFTGIAGFDGTNVQPVKTTTSGVAQVNVCNVTGATCASIINSGLTTNMSSVGGTAIGAPTAAGSSASGNILGVQGVASGVPVATNLTQVNGATVDPCEADSKSNYAVNVSTSTTTTAVALSSGKRVLVCKVFLVAGGTDSVTLEYSTSSSCASGTTAFTGAVPLTAQAGWVEGNGAGEVYIVPSGDSLCIVTNAAVQLSGSIEYLQQ